MLDPQVLQGTLVVHASVGQGHVEQGLAVGQYGQDLGVAVARAVELHTGAVQGQRAVLKLVRAVQQDVLGGIG